MNELKEIVNRLDGYISEPIMFVVSRAVRDKGTGHWDLLVKAYDKESGAELDDIHGGMSIIVERLYNKFDTIDYGFVVIESKDFENGTYRLEVKMVSK